MICFIWPELLKLSSSRVQSVFNFNALSDTQGTASNEEKGSSEKLYFELLCEVQVLTQLNYCKSKQVKSINSRTVTPLLIQTSHVNGQENIYSTFIYSFILAVGKKIDFVFDLKCSESRFKHSLCRRYIKNIDFFFKCQPHIFCVHFWESLGTHVTIVSDISIFAFPFMISGTCCSPEEQRTVLKVKWAVRICGGGDRQSTTVHTVTCPATAVR